MTYNVEIIAINREERKKALVAYRVTDKHLEAIIEHIMPLYNPLAHEMIITANITKEEAENERNRFYKTP